MPDFRAEQSEWIEKARAAGPGYRVWRWEEHVDRMPYVIFRFRLLAPGEPEPDDLTGTVILG